MSKGAVDPSVAFTALLPARLPEIYGPELVLAFASLPVATPHRLAREGPQSRVAFLTGDMHSSYHQQ